MKPNNFHDSNDNYETSISVMIIALPIILVAVILNALDAIVHVFKGEIDG